jgi:hypothetical protein
MSPIPMSVGRILWEKALALEPEEWTLRDIIDFADDKYGQYEAPTGMVIFIRLSDGEIFQQAD